MAVEDSTPEPTFCVYLTFKALIIFIHAGGFVNWSSLKFDRGNYGIYRIKRRRCHAENGERM
jgi:hypothetical protein